MREHTVHIDEKGKKLKSTEYISVLFMINKHFDKCPCKQRLTLQFGPIEGPLLMQVYLTCQITSNSP